MPTFKSRGLRGSTFEELINDSNDKYEKSELLVVQKVPTPITPVEMDKERGHITLAYFEKKSTVDYIGVVQGIAICFDAKECHSDTFPLQNVHDHQVKFMTNFSRQDAIAFMLIYFTEHDDYYFMPIDEILTYYNRMQEGGRKSFRRDELRADRFFVPKPGLFVPYLDMISKYLSEIDEA